MTLVFRTQHYGQLLLILFVQSIPIMFLVNRSCVNPSNLTLKLDFFYVTLNLVFVTSCRCLGSESFKCWSLCRVQRARVQPPLRGLVSFMDKRHLNFSFELILSLFILRRSYLFRNLLSTQVLVPVGGRIIADLVGASRSIRHFYLRDLAMRPGFIVWRVFEVTLRQLVLIRLYFWKRKLLVVISES